MIRRWARVNKLNENLNIKKTKYFNFFFVTFKKSIIFKKYRIGHTRFIRKALIKAKHKGNWSIYLQIFKSWVLDFKFSKAFVKYQLFKETFCFNVVIYDFCHFNLKQFNDYQSRFFLSSHLPKSMRQTLSPYKKIHDFSHIPATVAYLPDAKSFSLFKTDKPVYFPVYLRISSFWTVMNLKEDFYFSKHVYDFNVFLESYNRLSYKQTNEVYKLLVLFWLRLLF